jgi:hypothetical protein
MEIMKRGVRSPRVDVHRGWRPKGFGEQLGQREPPIVGDGSPIHSSMSLPDQRRKRYGRQLRRRRHVNLVRAWAVAWRPSAAARGRRLWKATVSCVAWTHQPDKQYHSCSQNAHSSPGLQHRVISLVGDAGRNISSAGGVRLASH